MTHAKQTRTHVAHPSIIPSEEEVRKLMKALALKEAEEAALLRGLVCLKLLNTRLCERDANDMSSNCDFGMDVFCLTMIKCLH